MKKCKKGHYYCYQDSKCKPIPKGYRIGVGGYLRRGRDEDQEESKKNGNGNGNGNSKSNGNGGNGSGNGNGGSGGNGGGNGSGGGVGESVEIQNSDGNVTALVTDIIGPDHMKPRLNGKGVWTGTHITEMGNRIKSGGYTILGSGNKKDGSKGPNEQTPVDYRNVGEGLPLASKQYSNDGKVNLDALIKKLNPGGRKIKKKFTDGQSPLYPDLDKAHYEPEGDIVERKMTEKEKRKDDRLKKKYDKSDMKKNMQDQYGKEEGKKVYFATIRKQAMEEEKKKDHEPEMIRNQLKTAKRASKRIKSHTLKKDNFKAWVQSKITKASDYLDTAADYLDSKDDMKEGKDPKLTKIVKQLRKSVKSHKKQADYIEKSNKEEVKEQKKVVMSPVMLAMLKLADAKKRNKNALLNLKYVGEESNPRIPRKKGQPANSKKHSDLYTDENPKGTIHGLGFKDVATAKASVAKIRKSNRSHAHKIQAAVAMEQRAREMGKTSEAAVYRKFINSMKKKTKD